MPRFNVLYYPYFEPPSRWFRRYLMVFDTVHTVVPNDVSFTPPNYITEIAELLPNAFSTIAPTEEDKILDDTVLDRVGKAFSLIGEKSSSKENEISIIIDKKDGSMRIDRHSLLHDNKISDKVKNLLTKYKLIKPEAKDLAKSLGYGDFSVVDETASHLILSLLSDRIAKRKLMNTMTDQKLDFAMTSLNALGKEVSTDARNKLAYSILKFEIPEGIELLTPKEFNTLRKDYEGIRETFHRVLINLTQLYQLDTCENMTTLREYIDAITREFHKEVVDFKKSRFGRTVTRWTPLSIGGLSSITGAVFNEPKIAIASAAISVIITVVQEIFLKREEATEQKRLVRLLADMQEDIEDDIKKLI